MYNLYKDYKNLDKKSIMENFLIKDLKQVLNSPNQKPFVRIKIIIITTKRKNIKQN